MIFLGEDNKPAGAHAPFSIDWAATLAEGGFATANIQAERWKLPDDVAADDTIAITHSDRQGSVHTAWVKGGTAGAVYDLVSEIDLPEPTPGAGVQTRQRAFKLIVTG